MASPLRRLVVGGAIALILAAACSTDATTSGADDDSSDPITTDAEPVVDDDAIAEEAFTAWLLAEGAFLDVPDPRLIEIGYQVCEDFDNGVTFTGMAVQAALDPVLQERPEEVGMLIGAAAAALCPEHMDEIP
jgi:hypothetical protein